MVVVDESAKVQALTHENATMRNLLVAWQNAYDEALAQCGRSEREKEAILDECAAQIQEARGQSMSNVAKVRTRFVVSYHV